MDWIQFSMMFITFVGLFLWNRTEGRADIRHMDAKLESNRNLSIQIHNENRELIDSFQQAVLQEMKDFHGRLCTIEERRK